MSTITKPDRHRRVPHLDECFIIHARNQFLSTALYIHDRFTPEPDWEAIKAADADACRMYGIKSTFGFVDFRERVPDLGAFRRETLQVVNNTFDGYVIRQGR